MKENENKKRTMKNIEVFSRAFKYIKPYLFKFFISFLLMFINVGLSVVLPIIVSSSTKELYNDSINLNFIIILAVTYLALAFINAIFVYFQSVLLQKTGQEIVINLRNDVFTHIESLSINQFNNIPVGKLVTRVTNDTSAVSDMFSNLIVNFLKNILLILSTLIIMFFVSWQLTLFMLIFVALVAISSWIFEVVSSKLFRNERKEISSMNSFISENLSGMKVTQVFNQEKRKNDEFEEHSNKLKRASFKVIYSFAVYRPFMTLVYISAQAVCFFVGIPYVEKGIIAADIFFLFYMYIGQFFGPIQSLSDLLNGFQRAISASERLFMLLDVVPEVNDLQDAIEVERFNGEIVFDHVWFAYEGENWILKDISFKIEKGQSVAFVGPTGAGKSTILSLIVRNYDIQKGHIYIDGIDLKKIKIASLRKNIGQMLQDVFLFSGNIETNIRLRNEDISHERIVEACKYVGADYFISTLPNKYYEEVRENGSNFSTGERQLLSFARTIVRNPSILILDEATANIDTETELIIQSSLEKMKSIGTMLIVAHRLSTIKNSDKIIVIDEGKILEEGNHEELLKLHGFYHHLCSIAEE